MIQKTSFTTGTIMLAIPVATVVAGIFLTQRTPLPFEVAALNNVHASFASSTANQFALAINTVFAPVRGALIMLAVAALLGILRKSFRVALTSIFLMGAGYCASAFAKLLVNRPRPLSSMLDHHLLISAGVSHSFPSGHTAVATAIVTLLCIEAWQAWKQNNHHSALRLGLFIFTGIMALVVVITTAWSRLYLGVHYPTDVIAAVLITGPITLAMSRWIKPRLSLKPQAHSVSVERS